MAGAAAGGAETHFVDLVLALARAGVDQRASIRAHPQRQASLAAAGVPATALKFGNVFDFGTRRGLARAFADERPAIVQTWMSRATEHCPAGDFVHVGWLGGYYAPRTFRRCDHVVAVTPDIVRHLTEGGFAAGRAHYIPTFAVSQPASPVARLAESTPEDAPLLLALGRLHAKKGFDVLLRALTKVPKAWLWIAGEGELRAELEALAASLGVAGRVRFLGWRTDREALLAACDVCVMPSRYEPFGTVMIEAWAAGKPLVVAAAAGPRGLVRDGVDALLVAVDDADALAAALARVVASRDLAQSLVNEGHTVYRRRFTEAAVVAQYQEFYERVGDPRNARGTA